MAARADLAHRRLASVLIRRFPDDAARRLESAPVEEIAALLESLATRRAVDVWMRLTTDLAAEIPAAMSEEGARRLIAASDPQRAASLLARMDTESRDRCLGVLAPDLARELDELGTYPPDAAGHLMDPRATAFRPDATARDALRRLRTTRARRVQDVFLTDDQGRLVASVPVQEIVFAPRDSTLESLARGAPAAVQATSSRAEVVEELERTRASSLAVVDYDGRLLGVLRQAELLRTMEQEASADIVTMVGVSKDERALSSPVFAVRKRLPWLQINLLTAFLAASVVGMFESTIARFTALAVLLPVVAGQSGNTGAQALAVTMRGLALREIRLRHWWKVSSKELTAGMVNGLLVALTTSLGVWVWSRSTGLALVIGTSMVISMTIAGLAGATIPMVLTAVRQDPAQSSSVILTTVTDVAGFFTFLGIATLLSSML